MFRTENYEELAELIEQLGIPREGLPPERIITEEKKHLGVFIRADKHKNYSIFLDLEIEHLDQYRKIYKVDDYKAILIEVPITHGVYEGIDTKILDERMSKVDWYEDLTRQADGIKILIELEVLQWKNKEEATDIAHKLMIRHFANTPMEPRIPEGLDRSPYTQFINVPLSNGTGNISFEEANGLLHGRSVMKYISGENDDRVHWIKVVDGYLKLFADFDLAEIIKQMPWATKPDILTEAAILSEMVNGKDYPAKMMINNKAVDGSIYVEPINKTIIFKNEMGREINWKIWAEKKQQPAKGKGKKGPGL
jgi:hypothetical protein